MKLTIDKSLEQGFAALKGGKFLEAELLYRRIVQIEPNHIYANYYLSFALQLLGKFEEAIMGYKITTSLKPDYAEAYSNMGSSLGRLKRFEEAIINYKKAISLKPDYIEAYTNLGITLHLLGNSDEAEVNFKKVIKLNPNFAEGYNTLAKMLNDLGRFDEAIENYKKRIKINPNFSEAHKDLGNIFNKIGKFEEAAICFKKAISLKSDNKEATINLNIILEQKKLLSKIHEIRKNNNKNNLDKLNLKKGLTSNPFISNRIVEKDLITKVYEMSSIDLNKTQDIRYGNGKCSPNMKLLENESLIIKSVSKDLIKIMEEAVNSEIYVIESFFNILKAGSGTTPHRHLDPFDKATKLGKQKYSLVYYLDVGDQNCNEPGTLKIYDPDEEILPTNGSIVIIPSDRKHSAIYGGKIDRVMIGINFYSLF